MKCFVFNPKSISNHWSELINKSAYWFIQIRIVTPRLMKHSSEWIRRWLSFLMYISGANTINWMATFKSLSKVRQQVDLARREENFQLISKQATSPRQKNSSILCLKTNSSDVMILTAMGSELKGEISRRMRLRWSGSTSFSFLQSHLPLSWSHATQTLATLRKMKNKLVTRFRRLISTKSSK